MSEKNDGISGITDWKDLPDEPCRGCREKGSVRYRVVTSSCGGYDDEQYKCVRCGHVWWIDGPDA